MKNLPGPDLVEKRDDGRYALLSADQTYVFGVYDDQAAVAERVTELAGLVEKGLHVHEVLVSADDGITTTFVTTAASGPKHRHEVMIGDREYQTSVVDDSGPSNHVHDVLEYVVGTSEAEEVQVLRTSGKVSVVPVVVATTKDAGAEDGSKVPRVLTFEAIRGGELPPHGDSGLPESLERDIPPEHRYWLIENRADAARVRLELVRSGLVSEDCLDYVDDQLRRIIRSEEIYVPDHVPGTAADVVVPEPRPEVDEAASACGLSGEALVLNAVATRAMGAEVALKTARNAGLPWILEFDVSRRKEVEKACGGDTMLLFELPWVTERVYLASSLPAGNATWAARCDDRYAREIRQRVNMSADEIRAAGAAAGGAMAEVAEVVAAVVEAPVPTEVQKRLAGRAHVAYLERAQGRDGADPEVLACFGISLDEVTKRMDVVLADETRQRILKLDEERRLVFGVVMEPGVDIGKADAHGEGFSAETIEKAAYDYIANYGVKGLMHKWDISEHVKIVDFHIVRADVEYFGQKVYKGSLVMAWLVEDDALWEMFKTGILKGFSVGGLARKRKVKVPKKAA